MLVLKTKTAFFMRTLVALILVAFVAGCSSYHPDVSQGNVVTSDMVAKLRQGMQSGQVLQIMGTPLIVSVFHPNRWDYIFLLDQNGKRTQTRRITLFFENNLLQRIEGDKVPSEHQFLAQILSADSKLFDSWLATGSNEAVAYDENIPVLEDIIDESLINPAVF